MKNTFTKVKNRLKYVLNIPPFALYFKVFFTGAKGSALWVMVFKLLAQASKRWHKLARNTIHADMPMVIAGAIFKGRKLKMVD